MTKASFMFHRSFYEASKGLNPEEKAELFEAICEYAFHDQCKNQTSKKTGVVFNKIKDRLAANFKRFKQIKFGSSYEPRVKINRNDAIPMNL